ncbi:MAG: sigma-70 family RNA polymerase sigma factor [Planctomycetes bacterium]|nr:sigma-70 family RNA polymerase sigma factor [Planctomycetota bacterium]
MRSAPPGDDGVSPTGWIQRLSRGDRAAREEICRRYGRRVERIVRSQLDRRLHRRVEAADIAQEVLLEIIESAEGCSFPSERAFLVWVYRIVEHKILKTARYWSAACRDLDRETRFPTGSDLSDSSRERPSHRVLRSETFDRLCRAVGELRIRDREIVVCRLFLDLPWPKVAALLDTTEAAAHVRFHRARHRLARALEDLAGE